MRSAAPAPHNGRRPAGGNLRFRANARKFRARAEDRPQNAPINGARIAQKKQCSKQAPNGSVNP